MLLDANVIIHWLQENIPGSPTIMEANAAVEYITWGNRMSIYTGLPSVVGWRWHQVQQRAVLPDAMVERRLNDVRECYNTASVRLARDILDRYGVRYVYVGEYEWAYYGPAGLNKFNEMVAQGWLRVAYDAHGVKIYEVIE